MGKTINQIQDIYPGFVPAPDDVLAVWDESAGVTKAATIDDLPGGGGTGDVVGPASSTDNAVARFDSTTGKLIQNSAVAVSDAGAITGANFDANGTGNSLSNVEVADLASGVLDTDLSTVAGTDTTIPSAKATKAALDAKQPLDSDLTTIAGLTPTTDNFIVAASSAWASRTPSQVRTTLGLVVGTDVQAYDSDLATIAGLTPTTDNFLVANASAWASRTPAQARTHMGLGSIATLAAPSGTVVGTSDTQTLTNKTITRRIGTTASSSTPTPDADSHDQYNVTALAAGATFGAPTGTPTDGQNLIIRIKDNGTARSLAFNAIYRFSSDLAAPTTTVISKTLYLGFRYNAADSKWDCLAQLNNF